MIGHTTDLFVCTGGDPGAALVLDLVGLIRYVGECIVDALFPAQVQCSVVDHTNDGDAHVDPESIEIHESKEGHNGKN